MTCDSVLHKQVVIHTLYIVTVSDITCCQEAMELGTRDDLDSGRRTSGVARHTQTDLTLPTKDKQNLETAESITFYLYKENV